MSSAVLRQKTSVTRNDVARACGVSGALVSYVFSSNARNKVKPETREKVLRTAEKMGYRPSLIGRSLKTRRSYNIALLLPERFAGSLSLHQLRIFHGVCLAMQETDYRPMIFFGINDKLFRTLREHRVDGLILLDSADDLSHFDQLADVGLPLVFANVEYRTDHPQTASVRSDHEGVTRQLFQTLVEHHCRRVLQISALANCQPNRILVETFREEAAKYAPMGVSGISFCPETCRIDDALIREIGRFFRRPDPCDGVLVDGGVFADAVAAAAGQNGVELVRNRNCFVTCSQENNFPNWSQDSFGMGFHAWEVMRKILDGETPPPLLRVPYFYAEHEKDLLDRQQPVPVQAMQDIAEPVKRI